MIFYPFLLPFHFSFSWPPGLYDETVVGWMMFQSYCRWLEIHHNLDFFVEMQYSMHSNESQLKRIENVTQQNSYLKRHLNIYTHKWDEWIFRRKKKKLYVMIPIETFKIHRLYCVRYFWVKQKKNTHKKQRDKPKLIRVACKIKRANWKVIDVVKIVK